MNVYLDDWDELKHAEALGWVDPGLTEPLDVTLARAREYLRDHAGKQPPVDAE